MLKLIKFRTKEMRGPQLTSEVQLPQAILLYPILSLPLSLQCLFALNLEQNINLFFLCSISLFILFTLFVFLSFLLYYYFAYNLFIVDALTHKFLKLSPSVNRLIILFIKNEPQMFFVTTQCLSHHTTSLSFQF